MSVILLYFSIYIYYFLSILVPEDASEPVRRFVEALFIIHTESKLNTSGRLVISPLNNNNNYNNSQNNLSIIAASSIASQLSLELQLLDREEWCLDLIFPHHRSLIDE